MSDIKKEYVISKQIVRSGTCIGANISEAGFAASKKDFMNKMRIAQKECNETAFWLKRLKAGNFITEKEFKSVNDDCIEIGKMLTASVKTLILKN